MARSCSAAARIPVTRHWSGVRIAMGVEHQYGVSPPPEKMKSLGGSNTGSTFYTIERAGPDVTGTSTMLVSVSARSCSVTR